MGLPRSVTLCSETSQPRIGVYGFGFCHGERTRGSTQYVRIRISSPSVLTSYAVPSDRDRHPTLFTKIRARYKSITEDILNLEDSAGALIREFRVGHSLGSYLCSYEGCPRASQGFSSLELRQQHQESHEPRFQCSNPACGFWKCSSEAALRKHTAKYHNGQDVSCVPVSFNSSFREVSQERSLFRLATPKRRSPVQEFPSNETFAGTRLSKSETPSETSPALLQRTDSPLEDEDVIPHLLGKQQHRVPRGWRTTVNQQERIANVNRMYVTWSLI